MAAILTLTAIDGQHIAEVTLPTTMKEVSLGQWITFLSPSALQVDAVMTGLTPEVLDTLSIEDRAQILELLLFLTDASMLRELEPTQGLYEVGSCAYGLYEQAQKHFAGHPDEIRLSQGAYLYALYRNPTASTMPADELASAYAAVLAAPVTEVIADCYHFAASWERCQAGVHCPAGPRQPGTLRIVGHDPAPVGLLSKLGLGNIWNPQKRALA